MRRRFYRNPLEEIEYCLRVGGTRHGELLQFLVRHPEPWRKKEMMLHREVNMSQATLTGALNTLYALGVVERPGRGVYRVDLEVIRKAVRPTKEELVDPQQDAIEKEEENGVKEKEVEKQGGR